VKRLERTLIVPDCHIPFEDPEAFDLMLKAGKRFKPDRIIVLGDFGDFLSCSGFDKKPSEAAVQFDFEMMKVNERLDEVDALGAKHKVFIEGNHEARLANLLKRQALSLYDTLTIPKVLRLKERGWSHVKYGDHIKIGRVNYTHDTGALGPYAHIRSGEVFQESVCIGHTHHAALSYTGNAKGKSHVAVQCGWLGSVKAIQYLEPAKVTRSWQHAFGVGYSEPNGTTHIQLVPIIDGKCVIEGVLVS
jgi:UDP-2,3-diacylglucosamine pyrophosphatase LpxH